MKKAGKSPTIHGDAVPVIQHTAGPNLGNTGLGFEAQSALDADALDSQLPSSPPWFELAPRFCLCSELLWVAFSWLSCKVPGLLTVLLGEAKASIENPLPALSSQQIDFPDHEPNLQNCSLVKRLWNYSCANECFNVIVTKSPIRTLRDKKERQCRKGECRLCTAVPCWAVVSVPDLSSPSEAEGRKMTEVGKRGG